ncbi:MAG: hypothetical protein ACF8GE_07260 [Phycisphaerales bacterium JB043]
MRRTPMARIHYLIALGSVLLAAVGLDAAITFMGIHLKKLEIYPTDNLAFRSLPAETVSWERARPDPAPLSAEMVEELGTSNYLTRHYVERDAESAREFEFHCAYYTGMIDTVPHVPERCFVGNGGLSLDGSVGTIVPVTLDLDRFPLDPYVDSESHGPIRRGRTGPSSDSPGQYVYMPRELESLAMNVSRFKSDTGVELFAGYFFIANGGTVPRAEQVRQLAFRHEDKYAYYAKIQFSSTSVSSAQELGEMAGEFLSEMLPDLMRRTPDWIAVKEGRYPPEPDAPTALSRTTHDGRATNHQGSGL